MGVYARIVNKKGEWFEMDRACFGFMSYIDEWDEDDIEDESNNANAHGECGLSNFSASEVDHLVYKPFGHDGDVAALREAMLGLPQFYSDWDLSNKDGDGFRWEITIPIADKPMGSTIIGAMMLRNIIEYTSHRNSFLKLMELGADPTLAFVLCQAYMYRHNAMRADGCSFYRYAGGDDCIFSDRARVCDIIAVLKGQVPDEWQGNFGDTDNGYGRYGGYGDGMAPESERTDSRKVLVHTMLVPDKKVYNGSPRLQSVDELGFGTFERAAIYGDGGQFIINMDDVKHRLIPYFEGLLK